MKIRGFQKCKIHSCSLNGFRITACQSWCIFGPAAIWLLLDAGISNCYCYTPFNFFPFLYSFCSLAFKFFAVIFFKNLIFLSKLIIFARKIVEIGYNTTFFQLFSPKMVLLFFNLFYYWLVLFFIILESTSRSL